MRLTVLTITDVAVGTLAAQSRPTIKPIPVSRTSPASGREMFEDYCAACHGKSGKGDGPAAADLKSRPVELTRLTSNNHGKFPEDRVTEVMLAGRQICAHGSKDMPIWGDLFRSLNPGRADVVQLRIANLTDYIQSIQTK